MIIILDDVVGFACVASVVSMFDVETSKRPRRNLCLSGGNGVRFYYVR